MVCNTVCSKMCRVLGTAYARLTGRGVGREHRAAPTPSGGGNRSPVGPCASAGPGSVPADGWSRLSRLAGGEAAGPMGGWILADDINERFT